MCCRPTRVGVTTIQVYIIYYNMILALGIAIYYYHNVLIIYHKYNFIGEYVKRIRIGSQRITEEYNNLPNVYCSSAALPRSTVVSSDTRCDGVVGTSSTSSSLTVFGGGSVGAVASSDILLFFARSNDIALL